ncbi:DUF1579 family protein [Roseomonas sp. AR75]|jgi:uncharacterized protein YndB with AHSA1/START domain|uniref:DUF1579 family protein n=1 Tax=Roseomonas sp. AR75 TaxID=2562311 RepID=UPI0010C14C9F|nr:DUF1579 family protein [Roseomonas sp. AR75]
MDTHVATNDLTLSRHIPAPPEKVFAAWVEPAQLKAWWGPYGMTVPEAEVDLRPGGFHRTLMRDAQGKEYPNDMAIDAVEAPRRLVVRVTDDACGPLVGAVGTLDFVPEGEGTRLDVRWSHPTAEMRNAHAEMGFAKGWGETLDKLTAHLLPVPAMCPNAVMHAPEHGWLHRMLGDWIFESECTGPDGQVMRSSGTERVTSLGGFWVVGENEGTMPGGGPARWTIALGYDAGAKLFRGSFIGSMMPTMFVYEGKLSEDGRSLLLDTTGPAFSGEGTVRYRDIVTLEDDGTRTIASEVEGPDGAMTRFMTARYRRAA